MDQFIHSATYSAEDDKLRIYPACRLPKDEYEAVKAVGFSWAPKQELFQAVWTPGRETLCLKMCGGIDEEDTTREERAEARQARFDQYSENALRRGDQLHDRVEELAGGIEFGQPILVGHHSEKKARKDAERIENGIRQTVAEYEKANYWEDRAASVKAHAGYLERPDVIYRRIKTLEAELRKRTKERVPSDYFLYDCKENFIKSIGLEPYTKWQTLTDDQKELGQRYIAEQTARIERHADRWIAHLEGRIRYERALLDEKGGIAVETSDRPLEVGGAIVQDGKLVKILRVNRGAGGAVVSVSFHDPRYTWRKTWQKGIEDIREWLTKAEYEAANPEAVSMETPAAPYKPKTRKADAKLAEVKGVKVIEVGGVADLFATPEDQVEQMITWAEIEPGSNVLEPSAGTAAILRRLSYIQGIHIYWCEKDLPLKNALAPIYPNFRDYDFMFYQPGPVYDRIVMNPPFSDEQDIQHVAHAWDLLKPGGILVAIVSEHAFFANNARCNKFRQWLERYEGQNEEIPPEVWRAAGTAVHSRMIKVRKPGQMPMFR